MRHAFSAFYKKFLCAPRRGARTGVPAALPVLAVTSLVVAPGAGVARTNAAGPAGPTPGTPHSQAAPAATELARSGDAYVRQVPVPGGTEWRFGTSAVEKRVRLAHGHLTLAGLTSLHPRHEYVQGESDVFQFTWNDTVMTGRSAAWTLDGVDTKRLEHGELLLAVRLRTAGVAVVKFYLLYPGESLIQEWLRVTNRSSSRTSALGDPASLDMQVLQREFPDVDFSFMTGGMCFKGSWVLKTQPLTATSKYTFDAAASAEAADTGNTFASADNGDMRGWSPGSGRAGTSAYAPIQIYRDRSTGDGMFVGWDYLGRWASAVGNVDGRPVHVDFHVAGYRSSLAPGASVETPRAFTGVFHGDLDAMGNQLLDWQYRYKWDYTPAEYFPAVRMLGRWPAGAKQFSAPETDPITTYRKVFRIADAMRVVGADMYWRDYGWWDFMGTWNGPNYAETRRYLAGYGMPQTLYMQVYDAERGSKVVKEHPEWLIPYSGALMDSGYFLDQSRKDVIDWELKTLEDKVRLWGPFEWRKDETPVVVPTTDFTPMLAQDQRFRELVKRFLDRNPHTAFHGCSGGGNDLGYEVLALASTWQMSDGCVGRLRNYYASYLFPPDKLGNMPDDWDPGAYDKEIWRGLLWSTFPMTGDTEDPDKLEGIRQLIDIYHYLAKHGVVGRWVRVYHPKVDGDSADYYFERLSRDGRRGIVIPGHTAKAPITIYPKGLIPSLTYHVAFQESPATARRTGADLMTKGVTIEKVPVGELIYLNLPLHPGSSADKTPPSAPVVPTKHLGTHMDYSGVELSWRPAHDDNWISYYEVYRNGALIDKVSKGTYYFDHALGADLAARYEVAAVDGSGNRSPRVRATGVTPPAELVVDDTSPSLVYEGQGEEWEHRKGEWSVANGTASRASKKGSKVTYHFEGNQVTWYGRLGRRLGIAAVYLDGRLDQLVDTFDGDQIPNVALYSRTFPRSGPHTVQIVATGERNPLAKGDTVVVDGFQVGHAPALVIDDASGGGVAYRGKGWRHDASAPQASAGTVSTTSHAGDAAEYSFTGTAVTWVGTRCGTCGMADVYVDGRLETTVDLYAPVARLGRVAGEGEVPDAWQVPVFTRSWPRAGRHTIRIVAREDANMLSKGHAVMIDALHVHRSGNP